MLIKAGQEFRTLQGDALIINKALHGFRTSGLRWNERLSDFLRDMGHELCEMEPYTWLKDCMEHYERIAVYFDDLLIASKDLQGIVDTLINKNYFNLRELALFLIISDSILEEMKMAHYTSYLENMSRIWKNVILVFLVQNTN